MNPRDLESCLVCQIQSMKIGKWELGGRHTRDRLSLEPLRTISSMMKRILLSTSSILRSICTVIAEIIHTVECTSGNFASLNGRSYPVSGFEPVSLVSQHISELARMEGQ